MYYKVVLISTSFLFFFTAVFSCRSPQSLSENDEKTNISKLSSLTKKKDNINKDDINTLNQENNQKNSIDNQKKISSDQVVDNINDENTLEKIKNSSNIDLITVDTHQCPYDDSKRAKECSFDKNISDPPKHLHSLNVITEANKNDESFIHNSVSLLQDNPQKNDTKSSENQNISSSKDKIKSNADSKNSFDKINTLLKNDMQNTSSHKTISNNNLQSPNVKDKDISFENDNITFNTDFTESDFISYENKNKKIPRNIIVSQSPLNSNNLRIYWDHNDKEIIKHYVIYKKVIGGNYQFFSQQGIVLPNTCDVSTKRCWFENKIKNSSKKASTWMPLQRYLYRITAVGQDNKESPYSETIEGFIVPRNHEEVLKDIWKTLVKANQDAKKVTLVSGYSKHFEKFGQISGKFTRYRNLDNQNIVHHYKYNNFQEYNSINVNGFLKGIRQSSDKILNINGSLSISGLYNAQITFQNCEIELDSGFAKKGFIVVNYNGSSQSFFSNDPMLDILIIR